MTCPLPVYKCSGGWARGLPFRIVAAPDQLCPGYVSGSPRRRFVREPECMICSYYDNDTGSRICNNIDRFIDNNNGMCDH